MGNRTQTGITCWEDMMALEAQGEELGATAVMGVVEMMAAAASMWAEA